MAMDDLFNSLKMFTEGVQSYQLQSAIGQANDHVQQIKAADLNDQQKRSELQSLSNQLVGHLAGLGATDVQIQAAAKSTAPKQFGNSNQMFMESQLTGDAGLGAEAKATQRFENDPKFDLARLKAQYKANPLVQEALDEKKTEFNIRQLKAMGDDVSEAKASSRTPFGQWATVEGRGARLEAVLGDKSKWKNLTEAELSLVGEGLVQMSKGGVATQEESAAIKPWTAAIQAARAKAAATGGPVALDLSGFGQVYNKVIQSEDMASKEKMLDMVMNRLNQSAHIADRGPEAAAQFRLTASKALGQFGLVVDPSTIKVNTKNGVRIPEIEGAMNAANEAVPVVKQALKDANSPDSNSALAARNTLRALGISADTSPAEAIKIVRRKIKSKIFE